MQIEGISKESVKLTQLLCPTVSGRLIPLPLSRGVRALNGDTKDNDEIRNSNHIGQTSDDRLKRIYDSIKKNGYPYNERYIIVYDDNFIIQDGQHRASCIYKLFGDIEIPIIRIKFKSGIHNQNLKKIRLQYFLKKIGPIGFAGSVIKRLNKPKELLRFLRNEIRSFKKWKKTVEANWYYRLHKKRYELFMEYYNR